MSEFPLSLREVYEAAQTGDYPALGQPSPELPKVVLSYGTAQDVNRSIVAFGQEATTGSTRLFADENAARHFQPDEQQPMVLLGSISTHRYGIRPGTNGILRATRRLLSSDKSERVPLRIATHAHLAARVALQAYVEGFDPVLELGMPTSFDESSEQAWTRSREAWVKYERKYLLAYSALNVLQRKLPIGMVR